MAGQQQLQKAIQFYIFLHSKFWNLSEYIIIIIMNFGKILQEFHCQKKFSVCCVNIFIRQQLHIHSLDWLFKTVGR